jgi:hypothetical protein
MTSKSRQEKHPLGVAPSEPQWGPPERYKTEVMQPECQGPAWSPPRKKNCLLVFLTEIDRLVSMVFSRRPADNNPAHPGASYEERKAAPAEGDEPRASGARP